MRKNTDIDKVPETEEPPLENQPLAWDEKNQDLEGRQPDLGELDEDPSEI